MYDVDLSSITVPQGDGHDTRTFLPGYFPKHPPLISYAVRRQW